jgi:undecaprenyl phosphate-alpha-L-ara4FN deformylase
VHLKVGLRIDVDTLRGTRDGVPALVKLLDKHQIKASFFMSVGPDNMGRNLWRLIKPQFLWKMLRSNGASLYGYDILLRGTAWPGPVIGDHFPDIIKSPKDVGHEVGLHAWDHYSWQAKIDHFSPAQMQMHMQRGYDKLSEILGEKPACSAAAGWRCNAQALLMKEQYGFAYNSDCRGTSIFIPHTMRTPQIPVTLPTYDEIIGVNGVNEENYNKTILGLCKPDQLNVYTIHAEVEGIGHLQQFEQMLVSAKQRNIQFMPLGALLRETNLLQCSVIQQAMPGREGWLAIQENV